MNFITKFVHELFTPHCQHCADERREQREYATHCSSCESLERENSRLVRENERLLSLVLDKPKVEEKVIDTSELKPIQTSRNPFIPSAVRRQTLEAESRATARAMREAPKPDRVINKDVELQELETELNNARQEREAKAVNS